MVTVVLVPVLVNFAVIVTFVFMVTDAADSIIVAVVVEVAVAVVVVVVAAAAAVFAVVVTAVSDVAFNAVAVVYYVDIAVLLH
jgi:hypothetical protein